MRHLKHHNSILEKNTSNPFLGMLPEDVISKIRSGAYGDYDYWRFFDNNPSMSKNLAEYIVNTTSSFKDVINFLDKLKRKTYNDKLYYPTSVIIETMSLYATTHFNIDMLNKLYDTYRDIDTWPKTSLNGKKLREVLIYNKRHSLTNLNILVKFLKGKNANLTSMHLKEINPHIDWSKTENYKSLINNWNFVDITSDKIKKNNNLDLLHQDDKRQNYRMYSDGKIRYIPASNPDTAMRPYQTYRPSPNIIVSTGIEVNSTDTANKVLSEFIKYLYKKSLALIKDYFKKLPLNVRKLKPNRKTATIKDYEIFWKAAINEDPTIIKYVINSIDQSLINKHILKAYEIGLF